MGTIVASCLSFVSYNLGIYYLRRDYPGGCSNGLGRDMEKAPLGQSNCEKVPRTTTRALLSPNETVIDSPGFEVLLMHNRNHITIYKAV